jgi:HAD superfamily hydrolase (TIGR01509 family)
MHYAAVLFDLDNTLYDYDSYWAQRLSWSLDPVLAAYPQLDRAALAQQVIRQRIYAARFESFLQQVGVADAAVRAAALARYRQNNYERLTLFAGAHALLTRLRQQGKVGLITNGPIFTQRPKIAQLGLEALMDVLVVSEEVGTAKPDPQIFYLTLEQLGVSPAQALYVGDSLEHDLLGAHAAGMDFVWLNPHARALPPELPAPLATLSRLDLLLRVPALAG